jgi:hypothetical protein
VDFLGKALKPEVTFDTPFDLQSSSDRLSFAMRTETGFGVLFSVVQARNLTKDRLRLDLQAGRIRIQVNLGGGMSQYTGTTRVADDRWHDILYVRNGSHHTLYVDGRQEHAWSTSADFQVRVAGVGVTGEGRKVYLRCPEAHQAGLWRTPAEL